MSIPCNEAFSCLATWAKSLGETEDAALFEETLSEENDDDEKLTEIAEKAVNEMASA
jgi:ferritin-like metal-binding protein YciE